MTDVNNPTPRNFSAFFSEFYSRFGLKSHRFFQILQMARLLATAIGFIPDGLALLNITLPAVRWGYLAFDLKIDGGFKCLFA